MKTFGILIAMLVTLMVGLFAGHRYWPGPGTTSPEKAGPEILYWVAPMDANFRRPEPGKSPMGMDLVPVYATDMQNDEAGVVAIKPQVISNLGVRSAAVEKGTLTNQIETSAYVQVNEETVHHIHTRVDGWVEKMSVKSVGERFVRGQVLFELYSPALVGAQEEYLTAVRTGNRSLISASAARLQSLGLNQSRLKSLRDSGKAIERVPVRASYDGIVETLNIRTGMYVQPSTTVMSIYTLENVWLVVELFERDSAWLATGSDVTVQVDALPHRVWVGAIDYIYPELDPVSRTVRARLTLDNPGELLLPNMYATVSVIGTTLTDAIHIPREALIRGAGQDRVVVDLGDGRFRSRLVDSGMGTATRIQILSGLEPGERVVVSGQFLLDSESNIANDLARYESQGQQP